MRRQDDPWAWTFVIVWVMLVWGCAADPSAQLVQQRESLTAFQDATLALHSAGTIDDDVAQVLATGSLAASGYLDAARSQIDPDTGRASSEFVIWLERFRGAMGELYAIEAERNTIAREVAQ